MNPPTISWTLEVCLIDPDMPLPALGNDQQPWRSSELAPIHILVHDCASEMLLSDMWKEKVADVTTEQQESLAAPELSADPSQKRSVTSWILPLTGAMPFFYIQCLDRRAKRWPKHEIFPDSTKLLDVLKRDQYAVLEFPTIWVSRKELPTTTS